MTAPVIGAFRTAQHRAKTFLNIVPTSSSCSKSGVSFASIFVPKSRNARSISFGSLVCAPNKKADELKKILMMGDAGGFFLS